MMAHETRIPHHYELGAQPAKSLLQRLFREAASLITQEADLIKAEAAERWTEAVGAAKSFVLAGTCGLLALVCLSACAITLLTIVIGFWAATLVVGLLYGVATVALAMTAVRTVTRMSRPFRSTLGALLKPPRADLTIVERESRVESTRDQVGQTIAALERKTDLVSPIRDTALGLGSLGVTLGAIARGGNDDR